MMEPTMITLENDLLCAQFNPANGTMVSLRSKKTGWELLRRPELGLSFLVELPLPDRHLNHIHGTRQKLSCVVVSVEKSSITFIWQGLQSEHGGTHDITFTATVSLGDNGLTFAGKLENRSKLTATVVCYPCLGDITPAAPGAKLERRSMSYSQMACASLYPIFQNDRGYWGCDNLGNNGANSSDGLFMLLAHERQGFYLGVHDHAMREMVNFFFRFRPGFLDSNAAELLPPGDEVDGHTVALELFVSHFSYVNAGETHVLAPVVMQPYQGSWVNAADIYRQWRATWFVRPNVPAWVREPHAWQQLQMNGAEDSLAYRYADLVEIGRECAKHGVKAIQLVGWNDGGQDRGNPSHDTDPRLGTWEELKHAIAELDAMGVKVILFSKFTWADRSREWYRATGHRYAVKDPYGDAFVHAGYQYHTFEQAADINTRRLTPMCHLSPEWREVAAQEFTKMLELGAAGTLYDECQTHGAAKYCFDPSHGHHVPAFIYGGDLPLCDRFLQESQPRDPDFLLAGEACYDAEFLRYHLSYYRIGTWTTHIQRYLDPYLPMMVAVTGFDDRNQLNDCLQHRYIISYEPFNFHGRLRDFPRTVAYGKQIDALRTRYREYLWDAEYSATVGASVSADNLPNPDYTVFRQLETGKRAVVIHNNDYKNSLVASVAFDGGSRGALMAVSPEEPEAKPMDAAVRIPSRSVAVVFEL